MKHFLLSLTAIVFFFSMISCDDDTGSPTSDSLVGTWTMQSYEQSVMGQSAGSVDVSDDDMTIEFNSDKTYEGFLFTYGFNDESGTYTLSGETLTLTDSDGNSSEYNAKIEGDKLTLTYGFGAADITLIYAKD